MRPLRIFPFGFNGADALAAGSGFVLFAALTTVVSFLANRHWVAAAAPVQPVEFDHRLHVEDQGLECVSCHTTVESGIHSGFPATAACSLCHLEPQGESAEEQRLVSLLQEGTPLEWVSVFRQPPHVFFSHRRHVSVAGLECPTCHGDVGHSERPPRERHPLRMRDCLDCHERQGASEACTSCHR